MKSIPQFPAVAVPQDVNRREFLRVGALAIPLLASSLARAQSGAVPSGLPAPTQGQPQAGIGEGKGRLKNVTLEMSAKPFGDMRQGTILETCRKFFRQWDALTREADVISVMLWTADGSEILEYRGNPDDPIEWARYIGGANPRAHIPGDPEKVGLHSRSHLYTENPAELTYRKLAEIVRTIKEVGRAATGKPIRVGATFDPGPEFARSPFKYERHNEICLGDVMGGSSFVCCYATLNADAHSYVGFPRGIPQGTPFGTFLGRQSQHFLTDLGFDYIWFSNGFGFGLETWKATGPLFDGEKFSTRPPGELKEKILGFWRCFRQECPDIVIETRGTNLLTGSDLATNATPLRELYNGGFNLIPPPNSPWAAINGDVGLELAGYMSRIAELPAGTGFPFRFYIHDPWWLNSPWLDRYDREPFDIYLPMAISRIAATGKVETANSIELLTIDNSWGQMPDKVPNEVIPHLLAAREDAPDQPGPLVWVYPLEQYEQMCFGTESRLAEPYFGDWFVRSALNNGFPLNTVVSSANFLGTLKDAPNLYRESVLVTPVPDEGSPLALATLEFARTGGQVLFYGPLAHAGPEMLAALNLKRSGPIEGDCSIEIERMPDQLILTSYSKRLNHRSVFCAGGMEAELQTADDRATRVLAWTKQGAARRVAALSRAWGEGRIGWVRGTNSNRFNGGRLLEADSPSEYFQGDLLLRFALNPFGYQVVVRKETPEQPNPVVAVSRRSNGFFLSGYTRDLRCELGLRFPQGAPLLVGTDTKLVDGLALYRLPRSWHKECRVFVEQTSGDVGCYEQCSVEMGVKRRLRIVGLKDAKVRFYPDSLPSGTVRFLRNPSDPFLVGEFLRSEFKENRWGSYLEVGSVTGSLLITW